MFRRNPSSRSASSPNVEEKVCISFSSCLMSRRGLSRSSRYLKPISLAKELRQAQEPKKLALVMPLTSLNAASNTTYSATVSQDSSRVTTTFNAYCTGHCTVEDFNVNFANSKSVRNRTVLSVWYHVQERNRIMVLRMWPECYIAVWGYHELWLPEVGLASETNGSSETRVTFFYTINPFGPSAGRGSRCLSVCKYVCKFVMSLWDHHEGRSFKVWFFSKTTGIDCVVARIYVSKKSVQ